MDNIIKQQSLFLHYLVKLSNGDKKAVIKNLTKAQCSAISSVIYNAIKKTFEIKSTDLNELKKYRSSLYLIADKKTSLKRKQALIARRLKQVTIILKAALKWIPIK